MITKKVGELCTGAGVLVAGIDGRTAGMAVPVLLAGVGEAGRLDGF